MENYNIINTLLRTEKGAIMSGRKQYLFSVSTSANKIQIKKAVENIFKVKVKNVNTQVVPGKPKRVRQTWGNTPEWKKALVTLKDGHKIDLA